MIGPMWYRCSTCGGHAPCQINGKPYCVHHVLAGIDKAVVQEAMDKNASPGLAVSSRGWIREAFLNDPLVRRQMKAVWN